MKNDTPIPKNSPELTADNFEKIKDLIIKSANLYNDRSYYDHYINLLLKNKDSDILEYFMGYFALVDNQYTQQLEKLRQDFIHNPSVFSITHKDSTLMGMWVYFFDTFESEAMNYLEKAPIQDAFNYLAYNKPNNKLAIIIDSHPYDDNYRKKYYEFIMSTLQNNCYGNSKNIRTAILSNNLIEHFIDLVNNLPGHSMNMSKFIEDLDVPDEYKLGIIL